MSLYYQKAQRAAIKKRSHLSKVNAQVMQFIDEMSPRAIAQELGHSRKTTAKAMRHVVPLPWNNGRTEGLVNRLKLIKRTDQTQDVRPRQTRSAENPRHGKWSLNQPAGFSSTVSQQRFTESAEEPLLRWQFHDAAVNLFEPMFTGTSKDAEFDVTVIAVESMIG